MNNFTAMLFQIRRTFNSTFYQRANKKTTITVKFFKEVL